MKILLLRKVAAALLALCVSAIGSLAIAQTSESFGLEVEKLSPSIRELPLQRERLSIPLQSIRPFLSQNRVVENFSTSEALSVLGGENQRLLSASGETIYVAGQLDQAVKQYTLFRPLRRYVDPETGDELGQELYWVASAQLNSVDEDLSSLTIQRAIEEVRRGDMVLAEQMLSGYPLVFYPEPAPESLQGSVIGVLNGVDNVGQNATLVLNKGSQDGVEVGMMMDISRAGQAKKGINDKQVYRLPDKHSGTLMIYQAFDKVSYGLVLKATQAMSVGDKFTGQSTSVSH